MIAFYQQRRKKNSTGLWCAYFFSFLFFIYWNLFARALCFSSSASRNVTIRLASCTNGRNEIGPAWKLPLDTYTMDSLNFTFAGANRKTLRSTNAARENFLLLFFFFCVFSRDYSDKHKHKHRKHRMTKFWTHCMCTMVTFLARVLFFWQVATFPTRYTNNPPPTFR